MIRGLDEQDEEKDNEKGFIESINQTAQYVKKYYEKTRGFFKIINQNPPDSEKYKQAITSVESLNDELMQKTQKSEL